MTSHSFLQLLIQSPCLLLICQALGLSSAYFTLQQLYLPIIQLQLALDLFIYLSQVARSLIHAGSLASHYLLLIE